LPDFTYLAQKFTLAFTHLPDCPLLLLCSPEGRQTRISIFGLMKAKLATYGLNKQAVTK
jgi:hypothetical protein